MRSKNKPSAEGVRESLRVARLARLSQPPSRRYSVASASPINYTYIKKRAHSNWPKLLWCPCHTVFFLSSVCVYVCVCVCVNFDLLFSYSCNLLAKRNK